MKISNDLIRIGNDEISKMLVYEVLPHPYESQITTKQGCYAPDFLDYYFDEESWYIHPQFHSDWNWLMLAIKFIEEQGFLNSTNFFYQDKDKQKYYSFSIFYKGKELIHLTGNNKLQIVFQAIYEFANKFNNKTIEDDNKV